MFCPLWAGCVGTFSLTKKGALIRPVTRRDLRPHDWEKIWPELAVNEEGVMQ